MVSLWRGTRPRLIDWLIDWLNEWVSEWVILMCHTCVTVYASRSVLIPRHLIRIRVCGAFSYILPKMPFDTYTWSAQRAFWRHCTFIQIEKWLRSFFCTNFDHIWSNVRKISARKTRKFHGKISLYYIRFSTKRVFHSNENMLVGKS